MGALTSHYAIASSASVVGLAINRQAFSSTHVVAGVNACSNGLGCPYVLSMAAGFPGAPDWQLISSSGVASGGYNPVIGTHVFTGLIKASTGLLDRVAAGNGSGEVQVGPLDRLPPELRAAG